MINIPAEHMQLAKEIYPKCTSQLDQEIFALAENNFKRGGYFVEFGATNGVELSNTFLLEKEFGWSGICAEPGKVWHKELTKNRKCHIDYHCVWNVTGKKISFHESELAYLSTVSEYKTAADANIKNRMAGKKYDVETITLEDLLNKYSAPKRIDYLSIDTEGSEYEVIRDFDFQSWDIQAITIEHNYMPQRKKIYELLTSHGFNRVHIANSKFDDWYTKRKSRFLYV
jgi:FkbM family methyltransferase